MKKERDLLGVFTKTYSSILPVTGLGSMRFKEIITQYSKSLNPQEWDYSDFKKYFISKDIVIEKSIIYNQADLKFIYKHLVKEAHKQMDFLAHQQIDFFQKNQSHLPSPLPNHLVEIEIEGKKLEINAFFKVTGTKDFLYLDSLIKDISKEIKADGALGVLFYSRDTLGLKNFILS